MFVLLGDAPDEAQREAVRVMAIETALAQASLTRVQRRDPRNLDHKMDFAQLQALSPGFDWAAYLKELGVGRQEVFNVSQPAFYKELENQLQAASVDDIKAYLRSSSSARHFAARRNCGLAGNAVSGWSMTSWAKLWARSSSIGRLVRR
jgi:predicted metalloendopeptidase